MKAPGLRRFFDFFSGDRNENHRFVGANLVFARSLVAQLMGEHKVRPYNACSETQKTFGEGEFSLSGLHRLY